MTPLSHSFRQCPSIRKLYAVAKAQAVWSAQQVQDLSGKEGAQNHERKGKQSRQYSSVITNEMDFHR